MILGNPYSVFHEGLPLHHPKPVIETATSSSPVFCPDDNSTVFGCPSHPARVNIFIHRKEPYILHQRIIIIKYDIVGAQRLSLIRLYQLREEYPGKERTDKRKRKCAREQVKRKSPAGEIHEQAGNKGINTENYESSKKVWFFIPKIISYQSTNRPKNDIA